MSGLGPGGAGRTARSRTVGIDPVIVGIVAVLGAHAILRIAGSPNLEVDEITSAVRAQTLNLFYVGRNPPLYEWLFFGASRLLGQTIVTAQLLRGSLVAGAAVFVYLAAVPYFRHRVALSAAIASYGATAFFGWGMYQLHSHLLAMVFAIGLSFWAFMRLLEDANWPRYIVFGFAVGLGLLAKTPYLIFLVGLLVGSLRTSRGPAVVVSTRMAGALVLGLGLLAPHLVARLYALDETALNLYGLGGSPMAAVAAALVVQALWTAEFWFPFVAVLGLVLYRRDALGEALRRGDHRDASTQEFATFVLTSVGASLVAIVAFMVLARAAYTADRLLVSAFALFPIGVFARIDSAPTFPDGALRSYRRATVIIVGAIVAVRFLFLFFSAPPLCVPRCVIFVDYRPLAATIRALAGDRPTIVATFVHTAGNLLRHFPAGAVKTAGVTRPDGRPGTQGNACVLVWTRSYFSDAQVDTATSALAKALGREPRREELPSRADTLTVVAGWQTHIVPAWASPTEFGVARIDPSLPPCR